MKKKTETFIAFIVVVGLTVSCEKRVTTVTDLSSAMKRNGIHYHTTALVDLSAFRYAQIDEALALTGDNLRVELFRINNEKTYKLFFSSCLLLAAAEAKAQQRLPGSPDIYSKRPFIIIVREEPRKGEVKKTLDKIFSEEKN